LPDTSSAPLLEVSDLAVHLPTRDGVVKAVDGVSYTLNAGETLGIVGESGSGKSVSCLTMLGLINRDSAQISGRVIYDGSDLLEATESELRGVRVNEISMIFQDPFAGLHPLFSVGDQLVEAIAPTRMSRNELPGTESSSFSTRSAFLKRPSAFRATRTNTRAECSNAR